MAIKKVSIEIDDSVEKYNPTDIPITLAEKKYIKKSGATSTEITEYDQDIDADTPEVVPLPTITTGRTFPDLIVEFKNDPRSMATILTFIPFIIFIAKIDCVESFLYPLLTGAILNFVWFVIPLIQWAIKKIC